ncbi:NUDIX hydrolase [Phycicoccus sp. Root563]|uniref:NUDIX hydrolase n=1 Tax=Phycicoccus sp. Root563 TaxID=1736562 RepID=UPI000702A4A3|nr:NUDIX hydrolase [Phycicoccus sp. Root563]KQZ90256.1 NUDIX hydrolase [Phycicoccus sp. Root563]
MTDTPRHSVSVAAAIFDESGENVLLIKRRDNGNWEPPGGVLELNETIEDGLRREVREETGAEIEVGPLTGVYKNMTLGIIALVFKCKLASTYSENSDEAQRVEWHKCELGYTLVDHVYSKRLLDASTAGEPAIRSHNGRNFLPAFISPQIDP